MSPRRAVAALGLAAIAVALFYLSIYPIRGYRQPLGFDTARYLWRNRCVADAGLAGLRACGPPLATSMPGRIAYPLVTLPARTVLGVDRATAAAVVPAVFSLGMGLAAAALLRPALRVDPVTTAVAVVTVATSTIAVRLAAPESYADNLIALGLGTAALALAAGRNLGPSARVTAAVMLGAAGLSHWPTLALITLVLLAGAALLLPGAWRDRRGESIHRSAAARFAAVAALGLALWIAATTLLLGTGPDRFFAAPMASRAKLVLDRQAHSFPITLPAAMIGVVALRRRRSEGRAELEALLAGWVLVVVAALVRWALAPALPELLRAFGSGFPPHRFVAMALPLPMLGAVAIAWTRGIGRGVGTALLLFAIAGWMVIGGRSWWRSEPFLSTPRLTEAAVLARYLDRQVPAGVPVIVPVDGVGVNAFTDLYQLADNLRAELPPSRIPNAYLYLGRTEQLLAGQPTFVGDTGYDAASRHRWSAVRRVFRGPHVVALLRSFSPEVQRVAAQHPTRRLARDVLILRGPTPITLGMGAPVAEVRSVLLAWAYTGMLVLLGLLGWGWSGRLARQDLLLRLALAPAVGTGVLVWGGLLADASGISPGGLSGTVLLAGLTAGGLWWGRRSSVDGNEPPS
ncbi:MAG TPA: hypothetical protein VM638_08385 [Actinomycetota bacterium]|nr:hypothetical protein [Actinomycetota bacterium]